MCGVFCCRGVEWVCFKLCGLCLSEVEVTSPRSLVGCHRSFTGSKVHLVNLDIDRVLFQQELNYQALTVMACSNWIGPWKIHLIFPILIHKKWIFRTVFFLISKRNNGIDKKSIYDITKVLIELNCCVIFKWTCTFTAWTTQ